MVSSSLNRQFNAVRSPQCRTWSDISHLRAQYSTAHLMFIQFKLLLFQCRYSSQIAKVFSSSCLNKIQIVLTMSLSSCCLRLHVVFWIVEYLFASLFRMLLLTGRTKGFVCARSPPAAPHCLLSFAHTQKHSRITWHHVLVKHFLYYPCNSASLPRYKMHITHSAVSSVSYSIFVEFSGGSHKLSYSANFSYSACTFVYRLL